MRETERPSGRGPVLSPAVCHRCGRHLRRHRGTRSRPGASRDALPHRRELPPDWYLRPRSPGADHRAETLTDFMASSPMATAFAGRFAPPRYRVNLYQLTYRSAVPEYGNRSTVASGLVAVTRDRGRSDARCCPTSTGPSSTKLCALQPWCVDGDAADTRAPFGGRGLHCDRRGLFRPRPFKSTGQRTSCGRARSRQTSTCCLPRGTSWSRAA